MPATFTIQAENLATVLRELRQVDTDLPKELRKEMKSAVQPLANRLQGNTYTFSPLSGFDPDVVRRRRRQSGTDISRYRYKQPKATVQTPLAKRARTSGTFPVVSIRFKSRKGFAGFEIMELAGSKTSGETPQGRGLIRALNARLPIRDGLGRQVIPDFKKSVRPVRDSAVNILVRYAEKVSRRLQ
jgi:hypothetical protein